MIGEAEFTEAVRQEAEALMTRVTGLVLTHGGLRDPSWRHKADTDIIIGGFRRAVRQVLRRVRAQAADRRPASRWLRKFGDAVRRGINFIGGKSWT